MTDKASKINKLINAIAEHDPMLFVKAAIKAAAEVFNPDWPIVKDETHVSALFNSKEYLHKDSKWLCKPFEDEQDSSNKIKALMCRVKMEHGEMWLMMARTQAASINVAGAFACTDCEKIVLLSRSMATFYAGIGLGMAAVNGSTNSAQAIIVEKMIESWAVMPGHHIEPKKDNPEEDKPPKPDTGLDSGAFSM